MVAELWIRNGVLVHLDDVQCSVGVYSSISGTAFFTKNEKQKANARSVRRPQ
jgi:hypothetical protein